MFFGHVIALIRFCIFHGLNICVTTKGTGEDRVLQLHDLKSLTIGSTDTVYLFVSQLVPQYHKSI